MLVGKINLSELLERRSGSSEWGAISVESSNMSTSMEEIFLVVEVLYPGVTFKVGDQVSATNFRLGNAHHINFYTPPKIQRNQRNIAADFRDI